MTNVWQQLRSECHTVTTHLAETVSILYLATMLQCQMGHCLVSPPPSGKSIRATKINISFENQWKKQIQSLHGKDCETSQVPTPQREAICWCAGFCSVQGFPQFLSGLRLSERTFFWEAKTKTQLKYQCP